MACETLLTATGSAITLERLLFCASSGLGILPAPWASSVGQRPRRRRRPLRAPLSSCAAPSSSFWAPVREAAGPSTRVLLAGSQGGRAGGELVRPGWKPVDDAAVRAGAAAASLRGAGADGSGTVGKLLDLRGVCLDLRLRHRLTGPEAAAASTSASTLSACSWVRTPAATSRAVATPAPRLAEAVVQLPRAARRRPGPCC